MKARAQADALPYNKLKAWEEAETREDIIHAVIDRELFNAAAATKLTRDAMRQLGLPMSATWEETLTKAVELRLGGPIVQYNLEYEDGTVENLEINISPEAVVNSGVAAQVGLI